MFVSTFDTKKHFHTAHMSNEFRKHLLDKFQVHLLADFNGYCQRHGLEPTNAALVTFMIDRELVPKPELQRFTVQQEVADILGKSEENDLNKTQAVGIVAHRFNISERTVWNMLKKV